jgi:hypothetical protein
MGSLEKRVAEATGGAERGEEEPERAEPAPLLEGLRRAYSGARGGVGCSDERGENLEVLTFAL